MGTNRQDQLNSAEALPRIYDIPLTPVTSGNEMRIMLLTTSSYLQGENELFIRLFITNGGGW